MWAPFSEGGHQRRGSWPLRAVWLMRGRPLRGGGGGTDSFPEGCLCFQLFSQAEETGCRLPATSAAPPQLRSFIFSLYNSWKSLLSLSMAGPCARQLNYPQDLRVPDYSSYDGPEQLHRYCLFQKGHMPIFICT